MTLRKFSLIVAADQDLGIGRAGTLPWRLPAEMARFKRITTEAPTGQRNAVIMGRKTYESILPKFRPLSGRVNVVLSHTPGFEVENALAAPSLAIALQLLEGRTDLARVFVAGGAQIYALALAHPACEEVVYTQVHASFDCDTRLPDFRAQFTRVESDGPHEERGVRYTFERWRR
ncbi:MAG TPA: dihydrofolate reductase [Polyangiales bacterium]|nr:dihydrofolate reductase [Polyangiales bacterium]